MFNGAALFGSGVASLGSTGGNQHLLEIRAGKMNLKGHTVYPDKRKGLLYMYRCDYSLMHFCWRDRSSGEVEDDLIIFPDDCEFIKVPECTTGRVYLLKFKWSTQRHFFWLQEPRTDNDEANCKRINEYLNTPKGSMLSDQDSLSPDSNISQTSMMKFFRSRQLGTRPGTGESTRNTSNHHVITQSTTALTTPTTNTPGGGNDQSVALTSALASIIGSPELIDQEKLRSTLQSLQVQQAVAEFFSELESIQQSDVVSQIVATANRVESLESLRAASASFLKTNDDKTQQNSIDKKEDDKEPENSKENKEDDIEQEKSNDEK